MTQIGSVYGEALYSLANEEGKDEAILSQLKVLAESFSQEPDFLRLLGAHNLTKAERCQILDDCFRGKVDQYVLNFLKILTEKNYIRHFDSCVEEFQTLYHEAHGILPVSAVTAVALTAQQTEKLTKKLEKITGKHIELVNKLDPSVLGGMRLDYDGKRVDDTVSHRLDAVRSMLQKTVL